MRVAAVDLGTNTTRLLVADVEHGLVEEVVRREAITRMGESVDRRRILLPTAVARVRNVLVDYRREAERLGAERVLAVGTSAVRDADNGEAFLGEIEWSYGFTTRMLDGGEEAELMLRGVASDRPLGAGTLLVDIGGGSTELVMPDGDRIAWAISTEAGSVRLTERFLPSDPPTEEELEAVRRARPLAAPAAAAGRRDRRRRDGDHGGDDLDRRARVRPPAPASRSRCPRCPRAASPRSRRPNASACRASSRPARR